MMDATGISRLFAITRRIKTFGGTLFLSMWRGSMIAIPADVVTQSLCSES